MGRDTREELHGSLSREGMPGWLEPMRATLTDDRFSDPDWIYERKLDGVRALAYREGGEVRLLSRNRRRMHAPYPEIVEALTALDAPDLVVDGEVVAFEDGRTSFSRLQQRMQKQDPDRARATGVAVHYYLFDLLHLDGRSTRDAPLRDRKRLLRRVIAFEDPLRFTPHRNEHGEQFIDEACADGWEGLIAKRASSPYQHRRSRDWLKFKCVAEQELVIGGFTEPRGQRVGFGALLVGYHENGALRYAGKVGTGYDEETLDELGRRLRSLERSTSPFDEEVGEAGVHWVTPELVAQIGFTEWTEAGRLRHPRFLGLRDDKDPSAVVRERPDG